jgi:hypothetical protein
MVAAPLDDISRLKDILDYRTAVAFLAIELFAIATLFALLMRAQARHLSTALKLAPLAEKVTTSLETNTRVLERLAERIEHPRQAPPTTSEVA